MDYHQSTFTASGEWAHWPGKGKLGVAPTATIIPPPFPDSTYLDLD